MRATGILFLVFVSFTAHAESEREKVLIEKYREQLKVAHEAELKRNPYPNRQRLLKAQWAATDEKVARSLARQKIEEEDKNSRRQADRKAKVAKAAEPKPFPTEAELSDLKRRRAVYLNTGDDSKVGFYKLRNDLMTRLLPGEPSKMRMADFEKGYTVYKRICKILKTSAFKSARMWDKHRDWCALAPSHAEFFKRMKWGRKLDLSSSNKTHFRIATFRYIEANPKWFPNVAAKRAFVDHLIKAGFEKKQMTELRESFE